MLTLANVVEEGSNGICTVTEKRPSRTFCPELDPMMGSIEPTTVVVCDDHPLYREGVVRTLRGSGLVNVIVDTGDGLAALEAIRECAPHVALLDYRVPGLDGIEIAHAISNERLSTRVLILSAADDGATVYAALSEGVAGFLAKDVDRDVILSSVIRCGRGENILPGQLASEVVYEVQHRMHTEVILSPRELQVVCYMARGLSAPQMAVELHLAPATIRSHIQKLYDKLGVGDRGAAVAEALRRGLID